LSKPNWPLTANAGAVPQPRESPLYRQDLAKIWHTQRPFQY